MTWLRLALMASVVMVGLMGSASSHTKPKHEYSHSYKHAYRSSHSHAKPHSHVHPYAHGKAPKHRYYHSERRNYSHRYHKPAPRPVPGRKQDGRYVLPGGLESVCAGGTPPPCVN